MFKKISTSLMSLLVRAYNVKIGVNFGVQFER